MKYCDILNKYEFDAEEKERQKEKELMEALNDAFTDEERITVTDVKAYPEEDRDGRSLRVDYTYTLTDNYTDVDYSYWWENETIDELTSRVREHIDYITQLRQEYPEYAKKNDYIQRNRSFDKEVTLYDNGYPTKVSMSLKLCGYLKLPNTTECGFGGGDYEIKRTPKRFKDFNENIDRLTEFFLDCISDLRILKNQAEEIETEAAING